MIRAAALILVLAVAGGADAQIPKDTGAGCVSPTGPLQTTIQRYYGCIWTEAQRLEPSGGSATEIAAAAPLACSDPWMSVLAQGGICKFALPEMFGTVVNVVEENRLNVATKAVLEARVQRAATPRP